MFRVQDEFRIETKSKRIEVCYFLLAYGQLIEAMWYPSCRRKGASGFSHRVEQRVRHIGGKPRE